MPWSPRDRHDLARDLEALLGGLGDARLVVREADHGGAVLGDDRQDQLEAVVLAGHRVDEGLALVGVEPGLERLDHRGVDAERHVGVVLQQPDHLREQLGLVDQRDARVDVEHVRAHGDLRVRVLDHAIQVAVAQLLREGLAPGRVDALADDAERLVDRDRDGPRP